MNGERERERERERGGRRALPLLTGHLACDLDWRRTLPTKQRRRLSGGGGAAGRTGHETAGRPADPSPPSVRPGSGSGADGARARYRAVGVRTEDAMVASSLLETREYHGAEPGSPPPPLAALLRVRRRRFGDGAGL